MAPNPGYTYPRCILILEYGEDMVIPRDMCARSPEYGHFLDLHIQDMQIFPDDQERNLLIIYELINSSIKQSIYQHAVPCKHSLRYRYTILANH